MENLINKITKLVLIKRNNKIFKEIPGMQFIWEMAANFGISGVNIKNVEIVTESATSPIIVINGVVVGSISREMLQDIQAGFRKV